MIPRKSCVTHTTVLGLTRFVDAFDNAVADAEVIAALLIEAQLRAFFHRASFAANQHNGSPFASTT